VVLLFPLLTVALLASCGPKAVRSPEWIVRQPARYPSSLYLTGVGSAPTSGGLAEALKAAGAEARAEVAQIIEVQIDHVQRLAGQATSVEEHRSGGTRLALETERQELSSFTRTSAQQIVQGIELKEKYHDAKKGVLYALAVLDKQAAGQRLEGQIRELDQSVGQTVHKAREKEAAGDLLTSVRLYREALNHQLRAEVLRNQLSVIAPHAPTDLAHRSGDLALALMDLMLRYRLYVALEGAELIEDALHQALAQAGFNAQVERQAGEAGLTLWGRMDLKWDTFPRPGDREQLQVCRAYLSIKIVDDGSGAIIGQVNLLDNSNAQDRRQAEERALQLLRQRVLDELPQTMYRALSIEMD
jgi:hypothetical protein